MVALTLAAAAALTACPEDASLGTLTFARNGLLYRVSLADWGGRRAGRVPASEPRALGSPNGRFAATAHPSGSGRSGAKQTLWITDRRSGRTRAIFSQTQYYTTIGPRESRIASLRYSLGYYGHHDWGYAWRP